MRVGIGAIEAFLAFVLLAVSALLGGCTLADWLTSGAAFLSFLCTQCAFDLAEAHERHNLPGKPGSNYKVLYIVKEAFWIASCLALGSMPLLTSTLIFGIYPIARKLRSAPLFFAHLASLEKSPA